MRSKYWRFSYNESSLKQILSSEELTFPEISSQPSKYTTNAQILNDLRPDVFIILANYESNTNTATARAIGKIESIIDDTATVSWKKIIPSRSFHPHKIGATQWANDNVFCFNPSRIKDFKLDTLASKLFP
jgi:hypothetical protein